MLSPKVTTVKAKNARVLKKLKSMPLLGESFAVLCRADSGRVSEIIKITISKVIDLVIPLNAKTYLRSIVANAPAMIGPKIIPTRIDIVREATILPRLFSFETSAIKTDEEVTHMETPNWPMNSRIANCKNESTKISIKDDPALSTVPIITIGFLPMRSVRNPVIGPAIVLASALVDAKRGAKKI